ncbi:hypothetical protein [Plebeiibacterium sediminum]|uniref:Uncharacterized protein n=1 Tax=Plebeiibacterium sediminum TaxID=2992112 RepID=A0AAE3SHC8_9BACT|nr:hypothetical protein [Plebeiobacterium sediminum]MCW3789271.1 hypothetical protein [Plebeiobacterium sediminum]
MYNFKLIKYAIDISLGWIAETNEFDGKIDRQADVYVFCLHTEKNINLDPNPLSSENWLFYVVPTALINEKLKDQKSVRISTIESVLNSKKTSYEDLRSEVLKYKEYKVN